MMRLFASLVLSILPISAAAQTPVTHYPWNEPGTYEPLTTTARAVTGAFTVLTRTEALLEGSSGQIRFGEGKEITITSLAGAWREWSDIHPGKLESAEIFRLSEDPGPMVSGNFLCSEQNPARYLVFYAIPASQGVDIRMLAFSSDEPPP